VRIEAKLVALVWMDRLCPTPAAGLERRTI
jgi:hypothetical protein